MRAGTRGRWRCLVAGLVLGCFNAWHWVAKEDKAMGEGDDE